MLVLMLDMLDIQALRALAFDIQACYTTGPSCSVLLRLKPSTPNRLAPSCSVLLRLSACAAMESNAQLE